MAREGNRSAEATIDVVKAKHFFDWLVPGLEKIFHDREFQRRVSAELRAVSPLVRWEAGPWEGNTCFFAISPNRDIDVVPIARQLAELAPNVPGWKFLAAKPRKRWQRSVKLKLAGGIERIVDLSNWKYWLTSFNDGEFFDVNLVPNDSLPPASNLQQIGELLAVSELGEDVFLSHVGRVNVVSPSSCGAEVSDIEHLHDQFMEELERRSKH